MSEEANPVRSDADAPPWVAPGDEGPPPPVLAPDDTPPPRRWILRLRRLLPWASMAMGVASALMLDRRPERAWIVPLAVGLAWVALTAMLLLHRERPEGAASGRLRQVARLSTLVGSQSLFQLMLFFVFPLYWQAATLTVGHAVFLAALGALAAFTLWDPLFMWVFCRPALSIPLLALAGFAGLTATLPFFGVGTGTALWLAAGVTAVVAPAVAWVVAPLAAKWRALVAAGALGAALPGALMLGAAALVPAAPLRVVDAGIGTQLAGRELAFLQDRFDRPPPQVVCATNVWAPLGLSDRLAHVWRHGDAVVDVVALEVRGGRDRGFRTWSTKRHLGPRPEGEWSCTVVTATGQVLARRAFTIGR